MKPAPSPTISSAQTVTLTADSQLMQDCLQTAGILVNTAASPAVAGFQNNDGDSEAVVIDINGNLQHVCREPLSDSGWNMYGLGAGFRWIAALDAATLWAIGLIDDAFWRNNHGRWTQFQIPLPSGATAMQVSAGTDGTVWALDNAGNLYEKNGLSWSLLSASTFPQQPPSGSAGNCWTIDDAGELLVSNGTEWDVVQPPENSTKADFVSVGTDGSVWVVVAGGTGGTHSSKPRTSSNLSPCSCHS
jgi:hypothetical protein